MYEYDPSFLQARREAIIILIVWAVCLIWTVGCSALMGYTDVVSLLFGMPSWIFWSILLPWVLATLFSVCFSLYYMSDDKHTQG